MLTVGSSSPAWNSVDQNGNVHASTDYLGQWLILYFYPKDDTPGCTIEACGFRDHWTELSARASLLGVSTDDDESHRQFIQKYVLPFPLLVDDSRTLVTLFGADGKVYPKRITFLIDTTGIIRMMYKDFDCTHHADDIIRDLHSLQS